MGVKGPLSPQAAPVVAEPEQTEKAAKPQTGITLRELKAQLGLARLKLSAKVRECSRLVDFITDVDAEIRRHDPEA